MARLDGPKVINSRQTFFTSVVKIAFGSELENGNKRTKMKKKKERKTFKLMCN